MFLLFASSGIQVREHYMPGLTDDEAEQYFRVVYHACCDAGAHWARDRILDAKRKFLEAGTRSSWGGSVWNLPAWKDGECELQDEGSQCVVLACEAAAGETVLDLCAGNGGKALALAALVGPSGAILAHDVVGSRLATLRASAERAEGACSRWFLLQGLRTIKWCFL